MTQAMHLILIIEDEPAIRAVLRFGTLQVDLARREARGADGEVHLTPLEYRALACLARHLGSIVVQRQLIREVWGPERQDDSRSLRVCIKNLRAKLEPDPRQPRYLVTETGLGYRLRADSEMQHDSTLAAS